MLRLRVQVLRNLIDETLKIQAAAAAEMEVKREEVEQTYAQLAGQNFAGDPRRWTNISSRSGLRPLR